VPRYALLPFDNLTGNASLDWVARTAPGIAAIEIGGTARAAATVGDAYLDKADHFVHGYFTESGNTLRLTVEVEDASNHKMVERDQIDGPVLQSLTALAKRLDPKAAPFSTSNEAATAAWGQGEFEKAVTLDPQFGAAWLSWIEGLARLGKTADAIEVAGRALRNPVKPEADALRIELARASLEKDTAAERAALVKLTTQLSDPRLLLNLASIDVRAREFALAEEDFKKVLAMEPANPDALNQLGYVYGYEGKIAEAEAAFAEYRKLPNQEANSYDSLGEVYFMNGKFAPAEKAFLRAQELNPALTSGGDLRKAAYAHWLAGDLRGADELFQKYLDFRARLHDPSLEWEHANWEYATGRKDQAIARVKKIASPQAALELRIWQGDLKLPPDLDRLKQSYEAAQPSTDGLFRTLYAEALLARGDRDGAKKLAARWPLPDSVGDPVLQSLVFPKYVALRRILGL
jgi:Tfp pilus assembly protein PilF